MSSSHKKLYIQMFSIHGLLRWQSPELGKDVDTGGQIKYVLEEALELSKMDKIERVDIFTRLIRDKNFSGDYSIPIEKVTDKLRIIRIQCGGMKYIKKELLWPHLDEYIDKTIKFIRKEASIPDIIHGHYADGGYVTMHLSRFFGIPFVFTAHSLGRDKKRKLLDGGFTEESINRRLKIDYRVKVEEEVLKNANLIITSTNHEREKQYGLYSNNGIARYYVIPPGINGNNFYPYCYDKNNDRKNDREFLQERANTIKDFDRFFLKPDKPLILALCRPDKRKNISGLIKAYGEDIELQTIANLAIYAGIRKNILDKEESEKDVLIEMLLLMDKYDLYGKMAIPKKHDSTHTVPELYRIAAASRGVFVNIALTEPFGMTLIEASSCGLPIIATKDGGPKDIITNCKNGLLVDPTDTKEVSRAIISIITNNEKWKIYSKNGIKGVKKSYTWESHAKKYIKQIKNLAANFDKTSFTKSYDLEPMGNRLTKLERFLFTDVDNTLLGEKDENMVKKLIDLITENRNKTGFGIATGRTIDSTVSILKRNKIPFPDIIISSVGAEIYYGKGLLPDKGWYTHISNNWDRDRIRNILDIYNFLTYQDEDTQRKHKISYFTEQKGNLFLSLIHQKLVTNKIRYNLIYSHGKYLDILPYRASKGKAIRYISYKWGIPLDRIMVCGDSGNDEDMLRGETLGVVVGNYSDELEKLKGLKNIYFSYNKYANGVIDGIEKYNFLELLS